MQLPGFQKRSDVSTGNNLTGLHCSWQNRPSVESVQELPTIKTLEDTHRKCPLWFAQQQLSNAKNHEHRRFNGQITKSLEFVIRKNGMVLEIWILNTWKKVGKCWALDGSPLGGSAAAKIRKAEIGQNCVCSMRLGHIRSLTRSPCSDVIPLCLALAEHQDCQDFSAALM